MSGADPFERSARWRRGLLIAALGALFAALVALGTWQMARRAWKLDLIDRVERHLQAEPVAAPGPVAWAEVNATQVYQRVVVEGQFEHDRETCTQAVTVRGPGCWVMTPLRTPEGWWVLINRGFVDPPHRAAETRAEGQVGGPVRVQGLLRLSEPGGGFLRANDPPTGRWTSRDVAAIAVARDLATDRVAPYFIDAQDSVPGGPVGGLTVVRFRNSHLVYALTWYGLAALALAGIVLVLRGPPVRRQEG